MAQMRALAQRRVAFDYLDQALGNGIGIQAEEPGKLPHAFAMSQIHDDGASIGRHSYRWRCVPCPLDASPPEKLCSNFLNSPNGLQCGVKTRRSGERSP